MLHLALTLVLTLLVTVPAFAIGQGRTLRGGGGTIQSSTTSPPVVQLVQPTSGGTAGGTPFTLTGSGFGSASAVKFNATAATSYVVVSATSITGVAPAGASTVDVTVTTPNGTSSTGSLDKFTYQDFSQSFVAGSTDSCGAGHLMDGTELRDLTFDTILNGQPMPCSGTCLQTAGCPVLFGFTGFWEDNACAVGQGPQIIALTTSRGNWLLDKALAGTTPCGGAQFNVTNSIYDYKVTYDANGAAVSPPVEIVVASGINRSIYARNNAAGTWPNFTYSGDTTLVNRSVGDHEDDTGVNPIDYLLIAADSAGSTVTGIRDATWLASPWGYTINPALESFCATWTSGTTCDTPCALNDLDGCTNQNNQWPFNLSITSGSSDGVHMTVHWATALQAPLSPGLSQVVISGITGAGCSSANATQTITAQTSTSATFANAATGCTYTSGNITTPTNSPCGTVIGCTLPNIRVLGITDCPVTSGGNTANKASFFAAAMNIFRRVDQGTSSFWRLAGAIPYPAAGWPTGQGQLRGLTCIVDSTKSNGWALLAHIEGEGGMYSMDPNTGIFTEETNLISDASNGIRVQWNMAGLSYGLDAYNSQGIYPITTNGHDYLLFGEGDTGNPPAAQPYEQASGKEMAYSGFWVRAINSPASASAPSFTVFPTSGTTTGAAAQAASFLNTINLTTPIPPSAGGFGTLGFNPCVSNNCPLMISTRAGPICSIFPEDVNPNSGCSTLFFGGFDANSTAVHSTAWIGRAPASMFAWP